MQVNQTTLSKLFTGFRAIYLEAYHGTAAVTAAIAMRMQSDAIIEEYDWLGAFPGMKEFIDEVQIENLTAHGFTIRNKEWYDIVAVKELHIKTDKNGIYAPRFKALGAAAAQHPDELVAKLLIDGFTGLSYTGKAFFAADHEPLAGGTKFSNSTNKKLSRANFRTARTNLTGRMNAKGRSMKLGKKLVLVVTPEDEPLAKEILMADKVADGGAGVTNIDKDTATILVLPELKNYVANAADRPWFLLETGYELLPFIMQYVEEPNTIIALDRPDSDTVFHNHEYRYQAYGIYNCGYGLPELAYGSSGTNAA